MQSNNMHNYEQVNTAPAHNDKKLEYLGQFLNKIAVTRDPYSLTYLGMISATKK